MNRLSIAAIIIAGLAINSACSAETNSAKSTETAYGARLNGKGEPATLNQNRVNNRISNRLENRLSLRIERYRNSAIDPTDGFRPAQDDKSHTSPTITSTQQRIGEDPQFIQSLKNNM